MKHFPHVKPNPRTVVEYWNGQGTNAVKRQAVFAGHLSDDEAVRQMLLTRQTPKRRIELITRKDY